MTEQQAKHTPGVWNISPCYFGGILDHFEINNETDGVAVTKCEANARLIAAAPELLAALKAMVFDTPKGADVRYVKTVDRARAAIAKAEGR